MAHFVVKVRKFWHAARSVPPVSGSSGPKAPPAAGPRGRKNVKAVLCLREVKRAIKHFSQADVSTIKLQVIAAFQVCTVTGC
jgi:hypothetical protein